MKCREFEASITELLNDKLEGSRRQEAVSHASACMKCAAALETQRRLSRELHALAADQSSEQSPPQIEQRLLSAFRVQTAGRRSSTHTPAVFTSLAGFRRRWLYATATIGLVLCALALYGLLHRPAASAFIAVPLQPPKPMNTESMKANPKTWPSDTPAASSARAESTAPKPVLAAKHTHSRSLLTHATAHREPIHTEVATDFYVIPYAEPFRAEESVRVLRTRVPRSLLSAFGLPINSDRAFDPIQADVLVGNDNVARAIRFVQQWQLPRTSVPHSLKEANN